jgi:mRNA interferase RelE/StbE
MKYHIQIDRDALKFLAGLGEKLKRQIARRIDSLAADPFPANCKKLSGPENLYRIRSGDYRIIYSVRHDIVTVFIVHIGNRKDVYRGLTDL